MKIKRFWQIGSASFTIVLLLILSAYAIQAQTWTASITATSSDPRISAPVTVQFGINPDSTNGNDAGLDVLSELTPLPPSGQPFLNVVFGGPGLSVFSTDIRPAAPWTLIIQTGNGFTLSWDISSAPANIPLAIDPGKGMDIIDMRTVSSKTFDKGSYSMLVMTGVPRITKVEPATGSKDDEITVEGTDFGANEEITIDFGVTTAIATTTTDEDGSFSAKFPITAAQPNGAVTIKATGGTSKQTAEDSSFIYSGPRIDSVSVVGSPASTGRPITVTLKGETEGVAKFSIEGVATATDLPMVEDPAGVYTGEYVVEPDVTASGAVVTVTFTDAVGNLQTNTEHTVDLLSYIEFKLSLTKGINLISIPLDTSATENPIAKVSDLAAVLGDDVSLIISYDVEMGKFQSFVPGVTSEDAKPNVALDGSTGLIVQMKNPKEVTFRGASWQPGAVQLSKGLNLIAIPLNDPNLGRVSDLAEILGDNFSLIISYNVAEGKFQSLTSTTQAGTPVDASISGGVSLIVSAKAAASFDVAGEAWQTPAPPAPPAAPVMFELNGSPVLELDGMVTREDTGEALNNLSITVRHLSTGASMNDTTFDGRFSVTFVYALDNNLVQAGDILEITASDSTGRQYGTEPVHYRIDPIQRVVTTSDIELGRISLGNLVASVIPSHSELLANFPNPFNPETWIPFKLKESADVTIKVYDIHGSLVRTLDLGRIRAGLYLTKEKAAYWDGKNDYGERVASGVYFYHLQANEFSALRKMVIIK